VLDNKGGSGLDLKKKRGVETAMPGKRPQDEGNRDLLKQLNAGKLIIKKDPISKLTEREEKGEMESGGVFAGAARRDWVPKGRRKQQASRKLTNPYFLRKKD